MTEPQGKSRASGRVARERRTLGGVLRPARWRTGKTTPRLVSVLSALSGQRRGFPLSLLAALAFLVVVGFWTRHAVNESLTLIVSEKIQTILDADVAALDIWIRNERELAQFWADDPEVRDQIEQLRRIGLSSPEPNAALLESQHLGAIRRVLRPGTVAQDVRGFIVVESSGLVLASAHDDTVIGHRPPPEVLAPLAGVLRGDVPFLRTVRKESLFPDLDGRPPEAPLGALALNPLLGIAAPVRDSDGNIVAILILKIDPDQDFTRILTVARIGETGETYAFDHRGYMISESRFEKDLEEAGVLPVAASPDIRYGMQLKDPGGNLMKGFRPQVPAGALPLTRMAASAVAGENGIDLEGYRDYRGVRVIGAWRWLDKYGLGVATEIDVEEAFQALRPLNIAHWALVGLLSVAVLAVLGSSYSLRYLSRRIEEVQQLGQYTLQEKIGEGGMGTVYLARHALLRRPTALKTLKKEALSEENVARFEREVQLTSQLSHPNIIEIYDYGRSPEGVFYYVMEYLRGLTLAELIGLEGSVPPARVIYILRQACSALEEAHAVGLVHRDIKPLNIMVNHRGVLADQVKVLDFGLVKDMSTPQELQLTAAHLVGGTPPYIAPERLKDPRLIDPRSDLFSIGAVGFNLLTGQDTFEGSSAMEICYKVLHETPVRPSERVERAIPPKLDELIMACLARDPEDRPQDAGSVIDLLDSIPEHAQWGQKQARAWWQANQSRIECRDASGASRHAPAAAEDPMVKVGSARG